MTRSLRSAPEPIFMVGADASELYIHLALTDEKVVVPRASREDDYVKAINTAVAKFDLNFIYPNSSLEMMVLTRHRDELRAPIFVPRVETQEIAASKWLTWQKMTSAGLPVPTTMLINQESDVEKAFDTFNTRPIWFRGAGIPGRGIGGAALPCTSPVQARGWLDFNNGYGGFIASEYLPGDNLTFLGIFDKGRLITSQGRQRDAYVIPHVSPSGITGAPAISHTVHRDDLNELGHKVVLAIDPEFNGAVFVDFKASADGRILPTEINAGRFGTTHHFYTSAGANFPYWMLCMAFGSQLPELPLYDVLPENLYWVRTLDAGPVLLRKNDVGFSVVVD